MTPDQIYFRLCQEGVLKGKGQRIQTIQGAALTGKLDAEGRIKGRAKDGTELKLKLNHSGKSLAAQLREEEAKHGT